MPIYEFKCNACGVVFEKMISLSDPTLPECTKCKSSDVRKKFSSFGFSSSGRSSGGGGCASCSSTNCSSCK